MDNNELLLTPEQRRAVETNAKDVVVLASPGGGKTALIVERIAKIKNGMLLTTELPQDIQLALSLYESVLRQQNAIDVDDMIVKAIELLDNPTIRSQVHQRFKYILVDEYQDINAMQEKLVDKMRGPGVNRFLVGDPDQTIYEWCGAKPEYISLHSKQAEVIQLTKNFRSSTPIVELANHVIKQNPKRNRKAMKSVGSDTYVPIKGRFESEEAQAKFVADQIRQLVDSQRFRFNDIAILVRNHSQTPVLEGTLSEANIPYGGELFWSQTAIKDALNLLYAVMKSIAYFKVGLLPILEF